MDGDLDTAETAEPTWVFRVERNSGRVALISVRATNEQVARLKAFNDLGQDGMILELVTVLDRPSP